MFVGWILGLAGALASPTPTVAAPAGPHAAQVAQFGTAPVTIEAPRRAALPPATPGPDMTVYGYLAWWNNDLGSVPWDELSHIAIFDAYANTDGTLSDTSPWDQADEAVAMAAPYGVQVHLCVTNFSPSELSTLLSSASARATLIAELAAWQATTGADGINVDFEGLPSDVRDEMVTFVRDLQAEVGQVVLATPSVDWAGSWNYSELTQVSDLFIMGYGYHWGGSSYAGPTDPLDAGNGTVWQGINSYSLSWSADDYIGAGADPSRIILGLPLYGMTWPTSGSGVPASTLATGSATLFSSAWSLEATHGSTLEPDSQSRYVWDGSEQTWFGDVDTVAARIRYARDDAGLGGIGFWALHYTDDDPALWDMVHTETTWSSGTGTTTPTTDITGTTDPTTDPTTGTGTGADPDWVADAGLPFLAYVGDIVMLSGEGSLVPQGATAQWEWSQLEGPPVTLVDDRTATPSFVVEQVGNVVFELRVGDGDAWSAPAQSWVVVIDPDVARRHEPAGCGCTATGGESAPFLTSLLALGLAVGVRRRSSCTTSKSHRLR